MQAGLAKSQFWLMEYIGEKDQYTEPLMHWTGSNDTKTQVSMKFASCQEAIDFATKNGWSYQIAKNHQRQFRPKSYAENFIRRS